MKVKGVMVTVMVGIACGVTGVAAGRMMRQSETELTGAVPRTDTRLESAPALAVREAARRDRESDRAAENQGSSTSAAKPEQPYKLEIPARLVKSAKELEIPEDVLRDIYHHYLHGGQIGPTKSVLRRHHVWGFRTLVAFVRAGIGATTFTRFVERVWDTSMAGEEQLLIDTDADENRSIRSRSLALRCLGETDTPQARDYLVNVIAEVEDVGRAMSAAVAVGKLKEARALPSLAELMKKNPDTWIVRVRWPFIGAIFQIGTPEAVAVLVDIARDRKSDLRETALKYLDKLDLSVARHEAALLLEEESDLDESTVKLAKRILAK